MMATKPLFTLWNATVEPGYADKSEPNAVAAVELGNVRTIMPSRCEGG